MKENKKTYTLTLKPSEFTNWTIAQDDDQDYSESGYIALVTDDGVAYMAYYSHCSCYGTWESLAAPAYPYEGNEATLTFDWSGTPDELVDMAKRIADPANSNANANPEDYDYDHLCKVYEQVIEWDKRGRVPKEPAP